MSPPYCSMMSRKVLKNITARSKSDVKENETPVHLSTDYYKGLFPRPFRALSFDEICSQSDIDYTVSDEKSEATFLEPLEALDLDIPFWVAPSFDDICALQGLTSTIQWGNVDFTNISASSHDSCDKNKDADKSPVKLSANSKHFKVVAKIHPKDHDSKVSQTKTEDLNNQNVISPKPCAIPTQHLVNPKNSAEYIQGKTENQGQNGKHKQVISSSNGSIVSENKTGYTPANLTTHQIHTESEISEVVGDHEPGNSSSICYAIQDSISTPTTNSTERNCVMMKSGDSPLMQQNRSRRKRRFSSGEKLELICKKLVKIKTPKQTSVSNECVALRSLSRRSRRNKVPECQTNNEDSPSFSYNDMERNTDGSLLDRDQKTKSDILTAPSKSESTDRHYASNNSRQGCDSETLKIDTLVKRRKPDPMCDLFSSASDTCSVSSDDIFTDWWH